MSWCAASPRRRAAAPLRRYTPSCTPWSLRALRRCTRTTTFNSTYYDRYTRTTTCSSRRSQRRSGASGRTQRTASPLSTFRASPTGGAVPHPGPAHASPGPHPRPTRAPPTPHCLTGRAWTKAEVASALGSSAAMLDTATLYAGLLVLRRSPEAEAFLEEWLELTMRGALSPRAHPPCLAITPSCRRGARSR